MPGNSIILRMKTPGDDVSESSRLDDQGRRITTYKLHRPPSETPVFKFERIPRMRKRATPSETQSFRLDRLDEMRPWSAKAVNENAGWSKNQLYMSKMRRLARDHGLLGYEETFEDPRQLGYPFDEYGFDEVYRVDRDNPVLSRFREFLDL